MSNVMVIELRRALKHAEIIPGCQCSVCQMVHDLVDNADNFGKEIELKVLTARGPCSDSEKA